MQAVYGAGIDGTTVSITTGRTVVPCVKAAYGDNLDPVFLSYMGSQEQDEQSDGTYKTDPLSLTMTSLIFRTVFMPKFPANGGGNVRMPIIVNRDHPNLGNDSDLLKNCKCINFAAAVENSSKLEEVELKFTVQQIFWTSERKTINRLKNVEQGESSL
jgi:hypothetical protein